MNDKKVKITFRMDEETNRMIKALYEQDNCQSQNEFIEKGIRFYVSYITTNKSSEFLNPAIYHAIKAAIKESESRTATNLFRLAVEMGVTMNILAEGMDINNDHIQDLRGKCITTVKKQRGKYTFEDAMIDANE